MPPEWSAPHISGRPVPTAPEASTAPRGPCSPRPGLTWLLPETMRDVAASCPLPSGSQHQEPSHPRTPASRLAPTAPASPPGLISHCPLVPEILCILRAAVWNRVDANPAGSQQQAGRPSASPPR